MTFAKFVFIAVDHIFNGLQNRRRMTRKVGKDCVIEKDIAYSDRSEQCRLDTYYVPKAEGKYPVIFEIHGGGFVAGDKNYRTAMSRWFADKCGAFVVNANYGLCPEVKFPTPIADLVDAMNWIYDNAEKYNLDLDRILVSGDSAGAYYGALLAGIIDSPEAQEKLGVSPKIRFAGANFDCGIYDIKKALQAKTLFNIADKLCYDYASISPSQLDEYEYIDVVSPLALVKETFPKTFVTYAEQDFFCGGQGPMLIEKLEALGVYNEHYHSTKFADNHTFSQTWTSKPAKENCALMTAFINKLFNGEI